MGLHVCIKKRMKDFFLEVDFHTNKNYLGVLGASGSGKSMTLKCIAGIETPDEGKIELNGRVLFDSEKKINLNPQERKVGYLFQNYALFPHMTVEENIGTGLNDPKDEKAKKIQLVLSSFHLSGLEKKYPHQLSGGQQQRVALARCLIYEPEVLMLDEPFSALDAHLKDHLQKEVMEILDQYTGDVLMVSHNRDEIYRFCEKLMILDHGKSILCKDTKAVFKTPEKFVAARLTGCKNFSKCDVIDAHTVYAKDWQITLKTKTPILKPIQHIGIRSHDLQLLNETESIDGHNIMPCYLLKTIEDVFDYNHYFVHETLQNKTEYPLHYTISIKEWVDFKNQKKFYIRIPEEAILLLE